MKSRARAWLVVASTAVSALLPTGTLASGTQPMVAASARRRLPEAERLGPRPEDPPEVAAVASLIREIHVAHPRCGSYCTSTRRDRAGIPDYSDTVVQEVDCWDTARLLVAGSNQYGVPLDEVLATAHQESNFRELAIGSGTECGMFQQSTTFVRWTSAERPELARIPIEGSEEVCRYLLHTENAMFHFAVKYHHERRQSGGSWSAYYNGGPNMWAYMRRHEALRDRFGRYVERYLELAQAEDVDPG